MLGHARTFLQWCAARPWLMAWAAFAKGTILGALITATVYRKRERNEGGGIAAAAPQVEPVESVVILGRTS